MAEKKTKQLRAQKQLSAQNLRGMVDKSDHSKAWSKHNISMMGKTAKERKELEKKCKNKKGLEVAMFMVKQNLPHFCNIKESVSQSTSLHKREKWKSEKANSRWWRNSERMNSMHTSKMEESNGEIIPGPQELQGYRIKET